MKLRGLVVDEIGDPGDELVVDGDHCFDGSRLWVLASEDAQEGPRAFAEKRDPHWQGR